MADPRQKAKDLIELALDDGVGEEERNNTAVRVIKIIRKYDLLADPLDLGNNEFVQAAKTIFGAFNDPKVTRSVNKIKDRIRRR